MQHLVDSYCKLILIYNIAASIDSKAVWKSALFYCVVVIFYLHVDVLYTSLFHQSISKILTVAGLPLTPIYSVLSLFP